MQQVFSQCVSYGLPAVFGTSCAEDKALGTVELVETRQQMYKGNDDDTTAMIILLLRLEIAELKEELKEELGL